MAETPEKKLTDQQQSDAARDEIMRSGDKASVIGSFSRFFAHMGGMTTSILAVSVGFVFSEGIKVAAGQGTAALLAAGLGNVFTSPVIWGLIAVSTAVVLTTIALDYYSGRIFREKGLDANELNAKLTAHHLVKGVSQSQQVEASTEAETTRPTKQAENDAHQPQQRRDGKTWLEAVQDIAKQQQEVEQPRVANAR